MVDNISPSRYIPHVRLNGRPRLPEITAPYIGAKGVLIQADCLDLLANIRENSIDSVFVDPPFNLGKTYDDPDVNDQLHDEFYRGWCRTWILELVRVLRPGGSLFLYHWPKWLMDFGAWLNSISQVEFRNWIALKMKNGFPIRGRLHPAHYGLLYYVKAGGEPTFNIVRSRSPACRKCGALLRDYGGYRGKYKRYEDEQGVPWIRISDFWEDTRPATHDKARENRVNELPVHIPERAILLSTRPGDVVLDCFVGSGSTIHAAQRTGRFWIGCDVAQSSAALKRIASFFETQECPSPPDVVANCFSKKFHDAVLHINPNSKDRPIRAAGKLVGVDQSSERYRSKSKVLGF